MYKFTLKKSKPIRSHNAVRNDLFAHAIRTCGSGLKIIVQGRVQRDIR